MKHFVRKYRTEIVLFTLGSVFFVSGLVNVLVSNRASRQADIATSRPSAGAKSVRPTVGPGEPGSLAAYIEGKKRLLVSRASQSPGKSSAGMISFDTYQSVEAASRVLAGRKATVHFAVVAVPLPGSEPSEVAIGQGESLSDAIARWRQTASRRAAAEASELDRIIPTVDDPDFKAVYQADAKSRREAAALLRQEDPSVIFGLAVTAPNSDLRKLGSVPGVRLVDLSEDAAASFESHHFRAVSPDLP